MELKYGTHKIPGGINCSNRTFMELKLQVNEIVSLVSR